MDFLFVDAKFREEDIRLNKETLTHCKKFKVLAVYASVQFVHRINTCLKQLDDAGITVISSKPDRTDVKFQILGCDSQYKSLKLPTEPDAFLYIGDGIFHPRALVLAQKDREEFKEVIRYDPMQDKMLIMGVDDCSKIFKKYKGGLLKFLNATNVGVLVTTKPGQQQFKVSRKLREVYPDKNIYYFAENSFDFSHLEGFNFIDVWVNSACTRIGFDDAAHLKEPMINVNDALEAKEVLSKDSLLMKS